MKDLFGKALLDYLGGNYTADIITETSISEADVLPIPYLFRSFNEMPAIEQKALQLATGKILDVGAGAGSHSLYLQEKGKLVEAIDVSQGAIITCKKRGVKQAEKIHLLDVTKTYDTILLLMNGTGIFNTLKETPTYLIHLKKILHNKGQILIDSSDIKYMFESEAGSYWQDLSVNYYGELDYYICYKGEKEKPQKWLYLDFITLKNACQSVGLACHKILEGEHYDYLAKITHL